MVMGRGCKSQNGRVVSEKVVGSCAAVGGRLMRWVLPVMAGCRTRRGSVVGSLRRRLSMMTMRVVTVSVGLLICPLSHCVLKATRRSGGLDGGKSGGKGTSRVVGGREDAVTTTARMGAHGASTSVSGVSFGLACVGVGGAWVGFKSRSSGFVVARGGSVQAALVLGERGEAAAIDLGLRELIRLVVGMKGGAVLDRVQMTVYGRFSVGGLTVRVRSWRWGNEVAILLVLIIGRGVSVLLGSVLVG